MDAPNTVHLPEHSMFSALWVPICFHLETLCGFVLLLYVPYDLKWRNYKGRASWGETGHHFMCWGTHNTPSILLLTSNLHRHSSLFVLFQGCDHNTQEVTLMRRHLSWLRFYSIVLGSLILGLASQKRQAETEGGNGDWVITFKIPSLVTCILHWASSPKTFRIPHNNAGSYALRF